MTRERANELLPVIQAFADGQVIQFRPHIGAMWTDINPHDMSDFRDNYEYRIKPVPGLRAWRPEEVPVGALVKCKLSNQEPLVILGATLEIVILSGTLPSGSKYISDLFTYHGGHNGDMNLYSTDNGATWKSCGIETQ